MFVRVCLYVCVCACVCASASDTPTHMHTQSKALTGIILRSAGKLLGREPGLTPDSNLLLSFMQCTFDLNWQADDCDFGSVCMLHCTQS